MRPQLPHDLGQRLRALDRRRGRHRRDRRRPGHRPPGAGHDDRRADPRRAAAAGHDAPPPGDLARGPARRNQLRPARPLRPRPHRLPPDRRRQPARQPVLAAAETGPVAAPDRPPRSDRKPRSPGQALALLAARLRNEELRRRRGPRRPAAGGFRENPGPGHAIRIRAVRLRRSLPLADGRYLARDGAGERGERAGGADAGRAAAAAPPAPPAARARSPAPRRRRCRWPGRRRSAPSRRSPTRPPPALARAGGREPRTPPTSCSREAIALLNRALHAQRGGRRRPPRPGAERRARGGGPARLRQRRADRGRRVRRRPRGRRPGRRQPRAGGGARRTCGRRNGSPRCSAAARASTPARPCCCEPAPTSTRAARARRRCSCGSASTRCWSSCAAPLDPARTPTRPTWRRWPSAAGEATAAARGGDSAAS